MIGLFAAVMTASLIGSPHCAGMCGPLALLASAGPATRSEWLRLLSAYHLARLMGYALLGALAGGLGAALDLGGTLLGLQRSAAGVSGAGMVVIGALALSRFWTGQSLHFSMPSGLRQLLRHAHEGANRFGPLPRSAGMGFLTVLLPCGWLYAFVITAAGTAHPALGATVMASFWVGTLPALSVVTLGARQLFGRWRVHLPIATSLLLIVTGAYLVANRAWIDYSRLGDAIAQSSVPSDEQIRRVEGLPDQEMPCCHAD